MRQRATVKVLWGRPTASAWAISNSRPRYDLDQVARPIRNKPLRAGRVNSGTPTYLPTTLRGVKALNVRMRHNFYRREFCRSAVGPLQQYLRYQRKAYIPDSPALSEWTDQNIGKLDQGGGFSDRAPYSPRRFCHGTPPARFARFPDLAAYRAGGRPFNYSRLVYPVYRHPCPATMQRRSSGLKMSGFAVLVGYNRPAHSHLYHYRYHTNRYRQRFIHPTYDQLRTYLPGTTYHNTNTFITRLAANHRRLAHALKVRSLTPYTLRRPWAHLYRPAGLQAYPAYRYHQLKSPATPPYLRRGGAETPYNLPNTPPTRAAVRFISP